MADETGAPPAPPVPPTPPSAPPTPPPAWHVTLAPEMSGYLQNKGWLDTDPKVAVEKITAGFQSLEKLRGVPAEQILRKPAPGDAVAERNFWESLGAPKEPGGYAFDYAGHDETGSAAVKEAVAKAAHTLGIPKVAAERFFKETLAAVANDAAREAANGEALYASEMAALRTNWGPAFDANMFIARQGAKALNVSEEAIDALQETMGARAVMEMFRDVGVRLGEDKFVAGAPGVSGAEMTVDGAKAKLASLMKDAEWVKRHNAGGPAEKAERTRLIRIAMGVSA